MWITPHASQKTIAMTLLADKPTLIFFGADSPGKTHCLDCCLVSGVLWCIHVSSTVANRRKNSSLLRLNNAKHSIEFVTRLRLWRIVTVLRIDFSYPSDLSKSKPLTHVICLWLPQSPALSISDRPTPYCEFFQLFGV